MKKPKDFLFKQFRIVQTDATHKVGTDGVLLGAWVNVSGSKVILDVGTGSGLIALMIAQRTDETVIIDGIDIQQVDAAQAKENVLSSPWSGKVHIYHASLQSFVPEKKYDLIVSNPPFFINSYKPPKNNRSTVRHTETLPFTDLIAFSKKNLSAIGRLAVILPTAEAERFSTIAQAHGLYLSRKCEFRSRTHKPVERWLMEFSFEQRAQDNESLTLHGSGEEWSDDYKALTKDFYIKI